MQALLPDSAHSVYSTLNACNSTITCERSTLPRVPLNLVESKTYMFAWSGASPRQRPCALGLSCLWQNTDASAVRYVRDSNMVKHNLPELKALQHASDYFDDLLHHHQWVYQVFFTLQVQGYLLMSSLYVRYLNGHGINLSLVVWGSCCIAPSISSYYCHF